MLEANKRAVSQYVYCQVHSEIWAFSHRLGNFWSTHLSIRTLKYTLPAIAVAAVAGQVEMHCGMPSCPKSTAVTSDAYLLKKKGGEEGIHSGQYFCTVKEPKYGHAHILRNSSGCPVQVRWDKKQLI